MQEVLLALEVVQQVQQVLTLVFQQLRQLAEARVVEELLAEVRIEMAVLVLVV